MVALGPAYNVSAAETSQSLRVILPLAPSSMSDRFARAMAPALGADLGQTVFVENVTVAQPGSVQCRVRSAIGRVHWKGQGKWSSTS